jgi:hypothetical protein
LGKAALDAAFLFGWTNGERRPNGEKALHLLEIIHKKK